MDCATSTVSTSEPQVYLEGMLNLMQQVGPAPARQVIVVPDAISGPIIKRKVWRRQGRLPKVRERVLERFFIVDKNLLAPMLKGGVPFVE